MTVVDLFLQSTHLRQNHSLTIGFLRLVIINIPGEAFERVRCRHDKNSAYGKHILKAVTI